MGPRFHFHDEKRSSRLYSLTCDFRMRTRLAHGGPAIAFAQYLHRTKDAQRLPCILPFSPEAKRSSGDSDEVGARGRRRSSSRESIRARHATSRRPAIAWQKQTESMPKFLRISASAWSRCRRYCPTKQAPCLGRSSRRALRDARPVAHTRVEFAPFGTAAARAVAVIRAGVVDRVAEVFLPARRAIPARTAVRVDSAIAAHRAHVRGVARRREATRAGDVAGALRVRVARVVRASGARAPVEAACAAGVEGAGPQCADFEATPVLAHRAVRVVMAPGRWAGVGRDHVARRPSGGAAHCGRAMVLRNVDVRAAATRVAPAGLPVPGRRAVLAGTALPVRQRRVDLPVARAYDVPAAHQRSQDNQRPNAHLTTSRATLRPRA
jgi:hypothetical protein